MLSSEFSDITWAAKKSFFFVIVSLATYVRIYTEISKVGEEGVERSAGERESEGQREKGNLNLTVTHIDKLLS